MSADGWSREFEFPAPGCKTFRDAADMIMKLPKKEQQQPHWQFATEILIKAAEQGGGWTLLAHMAVLKAMWHGKEPPETEPRRKAAKRYRIVR